jgi:hypothetical protein
MRRRCARSDCGLQRRDGTDPRTGRSVSTLACLTGRLVPPVPANAERVARGTTPPSSGLYAVSCPHVSRPANFPQCGTQ